MGWGNIIKRDSYFNPAIEELKTTYEKLISHPDYNRDAVNSPLMLPVLDALGKGGFDIETVIDIIHEGELEGGEKYGMPVRDRDQISPMAMKNWIEWTHRRLKAMFSNLARKRSMGLFESMAETMGVEIIYDRDTPTFDHGGLNFKIRKNELVIDAGNTKVTVCIVSSNPELPIGDYYTSVIGLIVARPTELDVLDFAIKLANVFKEYNNYWSQFRIGANVFTPFAMSNSQNSGFVNLIELLLKIEAGLTNAGARPAREMLEKIENALMDVFGSTRGFF